MASIDNVKTSFPNPWDDYAGSVMPTDLPTIFKWCERMWTTDGMFRQACRRIVRYFLTSVQVSDCSEDEVDRYKDFFKDWNLLSKLAMCGDDFMCYGNSFVSLHVPFTRLLSCSCGYRAPAKKWDYEWRDFSFFTGKGGCPKCKKSGKLEHSDIQTSRPEECSLIRWPIYEISIRCEPMTGYKEYYWKIPNSLKGNVKNGKNNNHIIEHLPWEVIEAIKVDRDFQFENDSIYHIAEEAVSGIEMNGWGLPIGLANFRQSYYVQILKRQNEAIALDRILPLRLLVPRKADSATGDPVLHQSMANFSAHMETIVKEHRKDPATWHTAPIPIEGQIIGGEGKSIAPVELLKFGEEELLTASGVPVEFYNMSLTTEAAPLALRLFQMSWPNIQSEFNGLINWFMDKLASTFNWETASAYLESPTLADSIEKKSILLQLMAGQQISKRTAFSPIGLDVREEIRRQMDEERILVEEQKRFEKEQVKAQQMDEIMAMQQQQAQMSAGGGQAPGGMGGGPMAMPIPGGQQSSGSIPMDQLAAQADQMADQFLSMPETPKRSQMIALKKTNPSLHALVKSKMEEKRQQAQTMGGFQMLQGGGGGM